MNYEKIYNQIIETAKKSERKKGNGVYYEIHHIIPKCMGGADEKDNLVHLTAKEHFICHRLLCEMYPGNIKLIHAFWRMCTIKNNRKRVYKISANTYNAIRTKKSLLQSEMVSGERNPMFGKSHSDSTKELMRRPKTDEQRRFQSESMKLNYQIGELVPHNKGQKGCFVHSAETRRKMSISRKGKEKSEEWKLKQSARMKLLDRKKILCIYCDSEFDQRNYGKWHGEKCKHKKPVVIVNEKA
jgi:hypothetical protein